MSHIRSKPKLSNKLVWILLFCKESVVHVHRQAWENLQVQIGLALSNRSRAKSGGKQKKHAHLIKCTSR
jgi:hypothetical protein